MLTTNANVNYYMQNHKGIMPHTCQNSYHQKEHKQQMWADGWKKKRQPLDTAGGTVNLYSHCGIVWKSLKKLKTELACDPAVLLSGTYPRTRTVI